MHRFRHFLAVVALPGLMTCLTPQVSAQAVMADYENSDAAAEARDKAAWRLAFRPDLPVLRQTVSSLRQTSNLSEQEIAEVDALEVKAQSVPEPEARRLLWHAATIALGKEWNPAEAAFGSVVARPSNTVLETTSGRVSLDQQYPVDLPPGMSFNLDLIKGNQATSATPERGEHVRHLANGPLSEPLPFEVSFDLKGVEPGFYLLALQLFGGSQQTSELAVPVYVEPQLESDRAAVNAKLSDVLGHEAARATALYPFELASAINAGTREVISYDFNEAVARSNAIARALERGEDPVYQATGLQGRAHRFAETGELVPYQVFVPSNWTPDRTWPLVVALHGANLDETNMLGRASGRMQALAQEHGYVVVAPLGYRLNSAYGNMREIGALLGADRDRVRRSESDVMSVIELVENEYNVDRSNVYLTGNSMGGAGTWWLAARHPGMFKAIAPTAFGGVKEDDLKALHDVPILAVVGAKDELGMRDRVKQSADLLRANGADIEYLELPDGTHKTAFDGAMAQIFDFFAGHGR